MTPYSPESNKKHNLTIHFLANLITEINGCIIWADQQAQKWLTIGPTLQKTLAQSTSISNDLAIQPGPVTDLPQRLSEQNIYLTHQASTKGIIQLTTDPISIPKEQPSQWILCSLFEVTNSKTTFKTPHNPQNEFIEALAKLLHELNNPLDATLRYLTLAQTILDQNRPDKAMEYLHKGQQGLQRIAMISQNMLAKSQQQIQHHHYQSLEHLFNEVFDTIPNHPAPNKKVTISYEIQPDLPCIDATTLFQVVCNVTKNAIDAMPQGGTLTITAQTTQNGHLILSFCDTGPGIPPEHMPYLFDPFFTTRSQGTGLGLTICRDLLKTIKGHIYTKSVPRGACFFIEVPLHKIT